MAAPVMPASCTECVLADFMPRISLATRIFAICIFHRAGRRAQGRARGRGRDSAGGSGGNNTTEPAKRRTYAHAHAHAQAQPRAHPAGAADGCVGGQAHEGEATTREGAHDREVLLVPPTNTNTKVCDGG